MPEKHRRSSSTCSENWKMHASYAPGKAGGSSVAEARVSRLCRLPLAARFTSSSGGRDISQPPAAPLVATQAALQLLGVGLASAAAQVVEDGLVQDPSLMLKLDGLISATLDHTPCAFTHCAPLRTASGQVFVQLEFSACYVALDPGRHEAEPVLVILLQRMTPPAAPPAATPTPLTHTDPSLPLPTPAAATVLQLGQGSQAAAGQQSAGAGAGSDQGPGAVGGGSGGAQLVSGSQLSSQLTFQLQLSHLALAHATAIITIMTLDGQVLYQNGRSVEYLGFMTGQAAAAGQSLHAPHHLLRRIFAADPLALDALMVATGQGQ
ncbi:guanylate cyclase domain-containing protein, partial [Haematococcus lacustris]